VLRCWPILNLASPLPCHARGEGWAKSSNLCCSEGRTRDDNKDSGQRICTTVRRCSTTNCAATLTIGYCLADRLHHQHRLLFGRLATSVMFRSRLDVQQRFRWSTASSSTFALINQAPDKTQRGFNVYSRGCYFVVLISCVSQHLSVEYLWNLSQTKIWN
jgi:hypothetical protein